jgi:hypothetical protein
MPTGIKQLEAFMKKSTLFLAGMTALLLSFGLILTGCDTGTGSDDGGGGDKKTDLVGTWVKVEGDSQYPEQMDYAGRGGSNDPLYFRYGGEGSNLWSGQMVSYDGTTATVGDDHNGYEPKSITFTAVITGKKLEISGLTGELEHFNGTYEKEGSGSGIEDLPESLTADEAKELFTDKFNELEPEEQESFSFIFLVILEIIDDEDLTAKMEAIFDSETPPDDLSDVPEDFWEAVADNWEAIKAALEEFGEGGDGPDPTPGGNDSGNGGQNPFEGTWTPMYGGYRIWLLTFTDSTFVYAGSEAANGIFTRGTYTYTGNTATGIEDEDSKTPGNTLTFTITNNSLIWGDRSDIPFTKWD